METLSAAVNTSTAQGKSRSHHNALVLHLTLSTTMQTTLRRIYNTYNITELHSTVHRSARCVHSYRTTQNIEYILQHDVIQRINNVKWWHQTFLRFEFSRT